MAGFIPLPFLDNACNSAGMTTIDFIDMSDDDNSYSSSSPNADNFWDSEPTLPTPPYSPCSSVDEPGSDSPDESSCVNSVEGSEPTSSSFSVVRPRCNSFLCSCMACECCCSTRADGPVLRDCMWSATTGLFPPLPIDRREPTCLGRNVDAKCTVASVGLDVNGNGCSSSSRWVTSATTTKACTNHTTYCVDPKTIFPYPMFPAKTSCDSTEVFSAVSPKSSPDCQSIPVATPVTPPASIVFDPDSDSASTSSSLSDDDMDEIDVVSVASVSRLSAADTGVSPMTAANRLLVLPAAESMSAQVAAIHNYSTTRCQPAQTAPRPSIVTIHHQNSYSTATSAKYARQCQQRALKNHRSARRRNSKITHHKSRCLSEDDDFNNNNSSNSFVPSEERCKRAQHNVMERQRRNHLKGNFFSLRDCLPTLYTEHRVSKVTILRAGADHIAKLTAAHETLIAERNRLRALQQRWKWKLSLVQREVRLSTGDVPM